MLCYDKCGAMVGIMSKNDNMFLFFFGWSDDNIFFCPAFYHGNIIYDIASALVLVSGIITRIRTSSCYNSFLQVKLNISLTQIFNIDRYFLKNKYWL